MMGEILEDLINQRSRLISIKQQIQNYDMAKLNQRIQKLNQIIAVVEANGG